MVTATLSVVYWVALVCLVLQEAPSTAARLLQDVDILESFVTLTKQAEVPPSTLESPPTPTLTTVVSYTIRRRRAGADPSLPAVFLLNGFNVPDRYYTGLANDLAAHGFIVAQAQSELPTNRTLPACPGKNVTYVTGDVVPLLLRLTPTESSPATLKQFQEVAQTKGLVLVGHSMGGLVTLSILSGWCQPGAAPSRLVELVCGPQYSALTDKEGRNIVRGGVVFEDPASQGLVTLAADAFLTYIRGQYDNNTATNLKATAGGRCVHSLVFGTMNHYGINDFIEGVDGVQVSPCNVGLAPQAFRTTREVQDKNWQLVARVTRAVIRSSLQQDKESSTLLKSLKDNPQAKEIKLDMQCLQ